MLPQSIIQRSLQQVAKNASKRAFHASSSSLASSKTVVVFGGNGSLGREVVSSFDKLADWKTINVDYTQNNNADVNVPWAADKTWAENTRSVLEFLTQEKNNNNSSLSINAVVNVAGGWMGGDAKSDQIFDSTDNMIDMNLKSAIAAAHVASNTLKEDDGLLVLTGAEPALRETDFMLGYGISKAGVHHIVKSLGHESSCMPKGTHVIGILPITIDTPTNRQAMPDADYSSWTNPSEFAQFIARCANGDNQKNDFSYENGTLYAFKTEDNQTTVNAIDEF